MNRNINKIYIYYTFYEKRKHQNDPSDEYVNLSDLFSLGLYWVFGNVSQTLQ